MFTPGSRTCAYKAASGRGKWPNRDPLGDGGSTVYDQMPKRRTFQDFLKIQRQPNMYEFVANDPITAIDSLGLQSWMGPGYGALPTPTFPGPTTPPTPPPWNTPPFPPGGGPYGGATFGEVSLTGISNAFGNNAFANCVRGCLANIWNPCNQSYAGGLFGSHSYCFSICAGDLTGVTSGY